MTFQILSLSGGGFLGLYTVRILEELEQRLGKPIARCFDLIAGTSVGGIVALGIAAEIPAENIRGAFERNGTRIFSDRPAATTWFGQGYDVLRAGFKPKYDGKALRETIVEIVGDDRKLGDLSHPIIIPAVNLTKGRPQVFKTDHHPTFQRDWRYKVADVAMATSAAPTYFPVAEINDELFVDGGLYANSPDLLALHEAQYFFGLPDSAIRMLSIGTTTAEFSVSHATGRNLGIWGWARGRRFAQTIISCQQLSVGYMVEHRLRGRYLRMDKIQSKEQERALGLDVATADAQKTIRGLAAATYQDVINNDLLAGMLGHVPVAPTFHNRMKEGT